jgi:hypothetical protein
MLTCLNHSAGKCQRKTKQKYKTMKMRTIIQPTIVIGALAVLAIPALADDDDKTVDWKDVPAAVQSTITANANGGKIGEIATETETAR